MGAENESTMVQSANILIVDDDPGVLRLAQLTLEREGFTICTADSGKAALEWLSQNQPELMLLDLKLKDMEGKELVIRLSETNRTVPFIIITGQGDERVAVEMMKRGALDYLVKDLRFMDFIPTVVRRTLEKLQTEKRLAAAQAELEESKNQLMVVSERERRWLGMELHDSIGQQLNAIELRCESLKQDLPKNRPGLRNQLSQICQYLHETISQTRRLARNLAPLNLSASGLVEALGELALVTSKEGRVKCTLAAPKSVEIEDIVVTSHLFRIAQEAAGNATKHSRATEVAIRLHEENGALKLEVSDNGIGLPEKLSHHQSIGLQIMKHRASVIGAQLGIVSKAGKGVTIICTLQRDSQ